MEAGTRATGARQRRRMPAADRREAILAAALDVFAHGGYHETSLDAVAARAGVSKALIYEHFRGKEELYIELLDMVVAEAMGRVIEAGSPAGATGVARFEPAIRATLEWMPVVIAGVASEG